MGEVQKLESLEDLRKAVVEAYQLVQQSHADYHEALAIISDTDHSRDGALAFQQRGREYGYAVRLYSDAVMVLLSHMEANRKKAVKQLSKHATAD
jgi:N-acetylglucosamine kinase-like BadF-type ATPase